MKITVATLIYANPKYLEFVFNSLLGVWNRVAEDKKVEYLVVANDPWDCVVDYLNSDAWNNAIAARANIRVVVHRNENPNDWWIQNVYNAWNRALNECKTERICFVNSDMAFTHSWLDNLNKYPLDLVIPTSRLVESERMPSLPGLIGKNFGQTIKSFRKDDFEEFAAGISEESYSIGVGAYMPSLFQTDILKSVGGWTKNTNGIPGDRITFYKLWEKFGLKHIMVNDSIVYHLQRGESAESDDLK